MSIADEIRKLAELRDAGHIDAFEFERAKARLFDDPSSPAATMTKRLRRSLQDRWIGGVCGGLATYTGTESWIWRLLFAVSVLFAGFGVLPYILLWIFVPEDK